MVVASPLACATKACFVMVSRAQVGAAVDFGSSWNEWNPSTASSTGVRQPPNPSATRDKLAFVRFALAVARALAGDVGP